MPVKVGESAKGFRLNDQRWKPVSLSDFAGKKVLLSFHPLAWTSVCAKQMESLEANRGRFDRLRTVPLGLSVDSPPCKLAWARSLGLRKTKLLSDFWPHGGVAQAYGIFDEEGGTSKRANILVDECQRVIFVKVYPSSKLPDIEEIFDFLGRGQPSGSSRPAPAP